MTDISQLSNRFDKIAIVSYGPPDRPNIPTGASVSKKKRRRRSKVLKVDRLESNSGQNAPVHFTPERIDVNSIPGSPESTAGGVLFLKPRGFRNYKNCCYLNVCLQMLLHVPPFVHLFNQSKCASFKENSLCRVMSELIQQFIAVPDGKELSPNFVDTSNGSSGTVGVDVRFPKSPTSLRSFELGPPVTANTKFGTLLNLDGGAQEDGAECLTRMLTRLHEELGHGSELNDISMDNDDEGDWFVADRTGRNRPVARKTQLQGGHSPISDLFCGSLVTHTSANHPSGELTNKVSCQSTKEPFFILPLDINHSKVTSIESALLRLSEAELITDYRDSVSGAMSNVNRHLSIDKLPPYLIMQLVRFTYNSRSCTPNQVSQKWWTLEKSQKRISVLSQLVVPARSLSSEYTFTMVERSYKLRAVIFHIGFTATSGHYTVAVRWPLHRCSDTDQGAFLYLDDTHACLIDDPDSIFQLLATHRPLDPITRQFRPIDSSNTTPVITKQPRTPYLLVYESATLSTCSDKR